MAQGDSFVCQVNIGVNPINCTSSASPEVDRSRDSDSLQRLLATQDYYWFSRHVSRKGSLGQAPPTGLTKARKRRPIKPCRWCQTKWRAAFCGKTPRNSSWLVAAAFICRPAHSFRTIRCKSTKLREPNILLALSTPHTRLRIFHPPAQSDN